MSYAEVIIDISHEKVDRPFTYRIPDSLSGLVVPGSCVRIPFGKGDAIRTGYCIGIRDENPYEEEKTKEILELAESEISPQVSLIRIAAWIRTRYGGTMIQALHTVMPAKQAVKKLEEKEIVLLLSREEAGDLARVCEKKHQLAKARLLDALCEDKILPWSLVSKRLHITMSTVNSLIGQGAIRMDVKDAYRKPVSVVDKEDAKHLMLSDEQQEIIDSVLEDERKGESGSYLIQGITGSGKTEVYLGITEGMVAAGKQVIVLIPEIALTYQTLIRFYRRFGERVTVLHSGLSAGERYDQYRRALEGDIDVIIGPRSALFTPFSNLGAIIIDEEHEPSYKSETTPRYHARETAQEICKMRGAALILGSATPSLESRYAAENGTIKQFRLTRRLTGGTLPQVYTVDLREELRAGNRSIFSRKLQKLMEDRLARKEQIMLFLNRRGVAGFLSCRSCGYVVKCPHCDVSLTEHRGGRLVCHYCGYTRPKMDLCPECGSKYITGFKAGTEQVEAAVHALFPNASVIRMDADTTRKKDSYEELLSAFSDRKADILIGTQMIVKGHDFPGVTLMGILAADLSLNSHDFRSGERTFQLITQAAGRAGRGDRPGEVVIQTYQPDHYAVGYSAAQDYDGFYQEEILYRELAGYPPAGHMMAVLVLSSTQEAGIKTAQTLIDAAGGCPAGGQMIGPAPAGIGKIKDRYRTVICYKHKETGSLVEVRQKMEAFLQGQNRAEQYIQFDFDPVGGF